MSWLDRNTLLSRAMAALVLLPGMAGADAHADESPARFAFEEQPVEFHDRDVKLAGSVLLPRSDAPVPAVVFVHGAGPQTREKYREVGEYFAAHGIAALIYDKRGTGQSGGTYESYWPYENLVRDALAGVALLEQRREIAASQIGIWGLSQGAEIAAAASASDDIRFVIVVGASLADGQMFYYRDNLFRRYGLSDTLRDVAEKARLVQSSLTHDLPEDSLLASFVPQAYPAPEQFVHAAWSQVHQPVLAMWGQLDQNVPVGESVAGLKHSLAQANNDDWTILVLPRANHGLGISETGALHSPWLGYAPGALRTMTDWAHAALDHPAEIDRMKQEGLAPDAAILPRMAHYESLRWYGNLPVQAALWLLFLISFGANTILGIWCCLARVFRRRRDAALPPSERALNLKRAIAVLNLLILIALTITVILVLDQLQPSCPTVLGFLPLLGTVSAIATAALLIVLAATRRDRAWPAARRIRFSLDVLCLVLFVPYLFYWDLIGLRF